MNRKMAHFRSTEEDWVNRKKENSLGQMSIRQNFLFPSDLAFLSGTLNTAVLTFCSPTDPDGLCLLSMSHGSVLQSSCASWPDSISTPI